MAPYCAIPRDYLSDTPLLRAMGFSVSQHGQLGAIPPPPFLSASPWRACEVEVRYPPPPQKGYLSDTCAIPFENKANGCNTPLCDTILKGYCAIWGGISHWAAKSVSNFRTATAFHRGFFKGGGIPHRIHSRERCNLFVRTGAVTAGPSRECDITFFVKGRPKSAQQLRDSTVAVCRVQT